MMSANLRAFLALIRICEVGTVGEEGYCKIVGGSSFGNWDDHPRILKSGTFHNGKDWSSTAAGGYQFLASTWDECKAALGLPDFSPASQDEAAVFLIKRRNALHAVEDGDLRSAIWLCNKEWASLPGSPYGQPTKSYADCERIYLAAGGSLSQAASATPQPAPPPTAPTQPAPTLGDRIVALPAIAIAAAQALFPIIADLMRQRGSKTSERNAEVLENVAPIVMEVAKQVVPGARNEQEVAEAILADKGLQDAFKGAMAVRWSDVRPFLEFEEDSRKEARAWVLNATSTGPSWRKAAMTFAIFVVTLCAIGGFVWASYMLAGVPNASEAARSRVFDNWQLFAAAAFFYWLGSSTSSRAKDSTIAEQAKR